MSLRADQKNLTRRRLIETALTMSAMRGFSALSLREVAVGAGITPAAFYRHFRDMEDLGLALLDEVGVSLRQLLRSARHRISPEGETVESSVTTFLEFALEHSNLFRLLLGERQGATPAFRKAIHSEMDRFIAELAEDLEREYTRAGRPLRSAALAAEAIVAIVFTIGAEVLELPKHKQAALQLRLVEEVKIVLRGSLATSKRIE
jgi:TetR/AcrR family transcriptional regulator, fatty acid biosynthesis regulator